MVQLEWVFLLQLVMGILMLMLLLRINKIQNQINGIIKEVKNYVEFITEEECYEEVANMNIEETTVKNPKEQKKAINRDKKEREEAQNRLIQAVLGEYFP